MALSQAFEDRHFRKFEIFLRMLGLGTSEIVPRRGAFLPYLETVFHRPRPVAAATRTRRGELGLRAVGARIAIYRNPVPLSSGDIAFGG